MESQVGATKCYPLKQALNMEAFIRVIASPENPYTLEDLVVVARVLSARLNGLEITVNPVDLEMLNG